MGDYTAGYARIRGGIPPEKGEEVFAILEDAGFSWEGRNVFSGGPMGVQRWVRERDDDEIEWDDADFVGEQITGDASTEVVHAIAGLCPDALVWAQTDPKYEWLGVVSMHVPELGFYDHDGDADGNPRFTAAEIDAWLAEGTLDGLDEDLFGFLGTKMGVPWVERLFPKEEEA